MLTLEPLNDLSSLPHFIYIRIIIGICGGRAVVYNGHINAS